MTGMILRILLAAAAGFGGWKAAEAWIGYLLLRRGKTFSLTGKAKLLLGAADAAVGGILGLLIPEIPALLCGILLLIVCTVLSVTDWVHRLIPNPAVLAILALTLLFGVPALLGVPGFPSFRPLQSLIGLAVGLGLFALPGLFGKNVGAGDIKLAGAMGFFLGIYPMLLGLIVMGLLVIGYGLVQSRVPVLKFFRSYIPMGPFIAAGMLTAFAAAPRILLL